MSLGQVTYQTYAKGWIINFIIFINHGKQAYDQYYQKNIEKIGSILPSEYLSLISYQIISMKMVTLT